LNVRCSTSRSSPGYLAVCDTIHFFDGEDTEILEDGWPRIDTDDPLDWLTDLWGSDGHGGMVHPGAWLTPRAVTEEAGPWDERLSLDDDGEYFARVVLASGGIRRVENVFSYYRKFQGKTNLSAGDYLTHHRSALRATDAKAEHILARVDASNAVRAKRALARH
jgi:hypothetical protein